MQFKIIKKNGEEKIVHASDLDTAEKKAGKNWLEIILVDKTKGKEVY